MSENSQKEDIQLLDVAGMARVLNVPVSRLYRETMKRGEGTIPRVKIGKYVRFRPDLVIGYFERQTQQALQTA